MNLLHTLRKNPWWIAGIIVLLAVLWFASGAISGDEPAETRAEASATTDVQVRHQRAERIDRSISVYGRTEPARSVTLKAETGGAVAEVLAAEGAYVKQGQDLLRLDVRDRAAQLERARADVRAAQLTYEAETKLKHESFASETRLAQAEAQLETAQAELKRIEVDLANTRVKAPFDGALQQRMVEKGDYVAIGDPIATFVDIDTLIISGSVSETERVNLEVGTVATARLVTGQRVEGKIRYIAPVADEATRTFRIEVEAANKDHALPAGVTAELELPAGNILAHKVSPAILTLDANGDVGIKTVAGDDTVIFTRIDIVKSTDEGVWISGLPPEADVITVGQGFVRPGERVVPVAETAAGAAAMAKAATRGDGQ